jgi:dipeptidyl aminopeptidase/acylaminoacyl peptidase
MAKLAAVGGGQMFKGLAAGVAAALFAASASAAPPPASAFARLPQIQDAAISADGHDIALLGGGADNRIISITGVDATKAVTTDIGRAHVRWLSWAGGYVIVRTSIFQKGRRSDNGTPFAYHFDRDFALSKDGKVASRLLADSEASQYTTGLPILQLVDGARPVAVVSGLDWSNTEDQNLNTRLKTQHDLVSALWRVDVGSGAGLIEERGSNFTQEWGVDLQGHARVRVDADGLKGSYRILGRAKGVVGWTALVDMMGEDKRPDFLAYSDAEDAAYLSEETADGGYGLVRYSLKDGARTNVAVAGRGALDSLRLDRNTGALIAIVTEWDRWTYQWLDPALAAVHGKLGRAFAGKNVWLSDWSRDRSRFLVQIEGPDSPPQWYFFDNAKGQLSPIGAGYPELDGAALGKTAWITYKARDGTEIPAYLTLPPGVTTASRLPLIVFPHGGPSARDHSEFDWWVQFLATRGYAVLQPQFRGSSGFGPAFEKAGRREWGGKMQTDLLDGIRDLADKGAIDPARVCIVGASYGGYAALAGAALHPEAYRCAVSVNGVSDLGLLQGEEIRSWGGASETVDGLKRMVGGASTDAALIDATSPARRAANVRAPVLLIASSDDTTVPNEQSLEMKRKLEEAGKPVELVTLEDDDHSLSTSASRLKMLQAIETFLARNLPAS